METFQPGIWSILPPFIAIFLAIRTRQVYLSLGAGILSAYWILAKGNLFYALIQSVEAVVRVFEDNGNTRTILFCALVGGLLASIRHNGGVDGFVQWMKKVIGDKSGQITTRRLELSAYITGFLLFIETSISSLTVGAIFRPLFDRNRISRDHLALIADTSSAPSSILIPLNAWGAFILSLLAVNGLDKPLQYLVGAMPFNFYPIVLIPLMMFVISKQKYFGPILRSVPALLESEKSESNEIKSPFYLIGPILTMVISLPFFMLWDGWSADSSGSLINRFIDAAGKASGTKAVLLAVISAIIVSALQSVYLFRKWRNGLFSKIMQGTIDLVPLALLMVLAFAIGQACKELQTGIFLSSIIKDWIPIALLPLLLFLISSVMAFSTGTSWGTFAIMLAIAIPMASDSGAHMPLVVAAVLSGGVFGDHCSPISDTTIISSMAAGADHIAHVRTQMPFALLAGVISALLFGLAGFVV